MTAFPFPILGIDSDNGAEFINAHLLNYCNSNKITFTRSRSGNKNDGAHVEQKNWSVVVRRSDITGMTPPPNSPCSTRSTHWSGCRSTSSRRFPPAVIRSKALVIRGIDDRR